MKIGTLSDPEGQHSARNGGETRGYTTWEQVAGYFDGDGCPKIHVGTFTLHVTVSWSDQDRELLEHIKRFLTGRGAKCRMGEFHRGLSVYHELSVTEGGNALLVLKAMLPFLDKKWSQVDAAVACLEYRTTGDDFIKVLNEAILAKRRSSSLINAQMPYRKLQGRLMRKPRPQCRVLEKEQVLDARQRRETLGLTFREPAKIYNVSLGTMHRALRSYP